MTRDHINPLQWHQSLGYARQVAARIFRDGGSPQDAMAAFGLSASPDQTPDWQHAVEAIAQSMCSTPSRRAA